MSKETEKMVKGRLTLTGNKMPDNVYSKLEKKGADRNLTPYVVSLVEKEETMDKLIESLSVVINTINARFDRLEEQFENITLYKENLRSFTPIEEDEIKQGSLEVSDKIEGGIEEEIDDMDF